MNEERASARKVIRALFSLLLGLLAISAVVFLVVSGLTWVICWGFDKVWSWKVAIGATVLMMMVIVTLKVGNS